MPTGNTSLLGLALPVQGELTGTWGDVVNQSITELVDTAVAGTTVLSTDADVTLTTTALAANQARQAILRWTASNGATTRNITAPAQSKPYIVINAGTGSIVLRGAGPTAGITIVAGERCLAAWNGSDFVKIATTASGAAAGSNTQVQFNSSGSLAGSANLTFDGSQLDIPLGSAAAPALSTPTDPNTGMFFPAADTIAFATAGSERARITSGGNFGIGTTSPNSILDVDANIAANTTVLSLTNRANYGWGIFLDFRTPLTDGAAVGLAGRISSLFESSNNYALAFSTTASGTNAERARITAAGFFGLGTNNPQARFDLAGDYKEGVVTANTGTAYTINTATGTVQILTLTGNCTFTFPTAVAGESFTLLLRQDGTGSRTVTWPAAVRWPGGTAPTITATANQTDKYVFTSDGTRWYGSNAGQAYAA
jgi:hypothetical protein